MLKPKLLTSSTSVPVCLPPNQTQKVIHDIADCAKRGDIEDAILLCREYCFESFSQKSFQMKRYMLKRLRGFLDEFFDKQLEFRISEQIEFPGSRMDADLETFNAMQESLLMDIRHSHGFSRLRGQCDALFQMMHENEDMFTSAGFELLVHKLTQPEDGA